MNDFTNITVQNDEALDQAPEALDPTQDLLTEGAETGPALLDESPAPASKYY